MKEIIFLLFPFIINIILLFFSNYWGYETNRSYVLYGSFIGFLGTLFFFQFRNRLSFLDSNLLFLKYAPWIFGVQFILFIIYNICNLNYGDGIILFENVFLEGSIFGYQSTIDELLEAFVHSKLFITFGGDPRFYYRITSTICGFLYLIFVTFQLHRNSSSLVDSIFWLSPGGLLLFYGYGENYSIVSIILFLTLMIGIYFIQRGKSDYSIYILAFLATIGALFHLVYGFMAIALIYFAIIQSTSGKLLKNAVVSCMIAGLFIIPTFSYFLFFADATIHASQTHALTMPIYPWRRMISMNHLKDIMGVIWFTSCAPVLAILYCRIFHSNKLNDFFEKPEIRFILLAILGFFIQAFTINPMLGFPTDWDLMSFYWIPLTMLAYYTMREIGQSRILLLPIIIFCLGFQINTAKSLHNNPEKLEVDYKLTMEIANDYVALKKDNYKNISQKKRKLFLKLDHFIFKSISILKKSNSPKAKALTLELKNFEKELELRTFADEKVYDKEWIRDYITRLTDFHHKFLEFKNSVDG
ncbi:hypothetical protein [Leptospira sp. GIMC2001]|uniref:hypothetical protein n=1 Tax=Leptospira sp. GIMC2001 TaxID=1513297 RepID=UPI002349CB3C|nr:hypothetical protein [Leptospira sp. GIMC2001]WCL48238.1 hypothetical protein O4O04_13085 [Leptospira sp. GIMC2001]